MPNATDANQVKPKQTKPKALTWEECIDKIQYSDRYSDDVYEYRHVMLPKPLLRMIPKSFFEDPQRPELLRLLREDEWRGIGITQSLGWEHYEVHAPEPHVLLFRRAKNFAPPPNVNGMGKTKRK
ncbi:regulatory subunit of cyclin-dependent kinase [Gautieria morchelliformis]|nr:regulatory subunit of cyclin-dependent kinase [Gautieria morchelliformis]